MAEFSKGEKTLAQKLDTFHWRAWLGMKDLFEKKAPPTAKATLKALVDKKFAETKEIKGEPRYRLSSFGRKLLRLTVGAE